MSSFGVMLTVGSSVWDKLQGEGNGVMGAGFIVLGNSAATGSIRVGRAVEGTDSTRAEMAALLEVLIGANVTENLVVMVDNQSILREINRWVDELLSRPSDLEWVRPTNHFALPANLLPLHNTVRILM